MQHLERFCNGTSIFPKRGDMNIGVKGLAVKVVAPAAGIEECGYISVVIFL
jgi:hypothetical protein